MINEAFISYVWKLRLFTQTDLLTDTNETVTILSVGEQNFQSGPDFFNAKIKIGDTIWAGNVEIHVKASDWLKHGHQKDEAYDNVILHLVYEADYPIQRKDGHPIPTLEIKDKIAPNLYRNYLLLQGDTHWIPCEKLIHLVDEFTLIGLKDRLLVERLERKTKPILQSLQQNKNSWENTFYQFLCRALGSKFNAEPFEQLAKSLPLNILAKHKNSLFQLEALLLGHAGLLQTEFKEEYPQQLKKEYTFLQKKFGLKSLKTHSWKFGGLRPANFPSIRLAQLAALIHQSSGLFAQLLTTKSVKDFHKLFNVQVSSYWQQHYVFDKMSVNRPKKIGKNTINSILINTIIPILFVYGKQTAQTQYEDKALQLLEQLPPEKNRIIEQWNSLGVSSKSALETQALLQLKNEYCKQKRCLSCAIGNKIMQYNTSKQHIKQPNLKN